MADHLTNYRSPFLEFLPIFSQVKKDKDVGAFEDLVEGLKVYDKLENGCMLLAELNHVLLFLGKWLDLREDLMDEPCNGGQIALISLDRH